MGDLVAHGGSTYSISDSGDVPDRVSHTLITNVLDLVAPKPRFAKDIDLDLSGGAGIAYRPLVELIVEARVRLTPRGIAIAGGAR
jgi:hypothetical protein